MNNKNETKCPYYDIVIIIRSGLPTKWCCLFDDKKECIFGQDQEPDAGECSYYLFPEDTPVYKRWKKMQEEDINGEEI